MEPPGDMGGVQMPGQAASGGGPAPDSQKEWHASVTTDLRQQLVLKIAQVFFPTPPPSPFQEFFVHVAKSMEKNMYDKANSRKEYDRLFAEKINEIEKKLDEGLQKRREQQEQQR